MFGDLIKKISSAFHGAPKTTSTAYSSGGGGGGGGGAWGTTFSAPSNSSGSGINNGQQSQPFIPWAPGSVLGTNTTGSYSGGSVAQPDTSGLQNSVKSRIQAIQNAYGALQGSIDPLIQQQVNQNLQNYDTQQNNLNTTYGNTIGQTQNMYGARGLGDSSFQGNALDQNTGIYNQNLNALNQDKQNTLAGIGQYAQGLHAQAATGAQQYNQYLQNLGSYSPTDLASLDSSLANVAPQVSQQAAQLGTNPQFLQALQQYAPQANQGATQLQAQLANLVKSSAPLFAKQQIAQGLVKNSQLTDPNAQAYYQDYFQKLLSGQA